MNPSLIKSFSVYGLFGTIDVHIPFDGDIKILVGENGLGKTQVLNIFYYALIRDFFKLSDFNFDKVILYFAKQSPVEIDKVDINYYVKNNVEMEMVLGRPENTGMLTELGVKRNELRNRIIDATLGKEILYFPTFRRVEEDLHGLGYDDQDERLNQEDTVIQFGMDDVSRRFTSIENKIDQLLKEGFAKISSEILSHLIKGFSETDNACLDKIDQNDIEIILARVGSQLPEEDKKAMRAIAVEKRIDNPALMFFLKKLIEIYESQKELDNSIKGFRDVCNAYLVDKKVFYDESAIKIYIKSDITHEPIDLKYLSSGEKQIISMFSKIYLAEENKRFIVLFDEPELSLSMIWQRRLLPDIINSKKCDFLLAVTHSPFIFDNDLDQYAVGLSEYITPSKMIAA